MAKISARGDREVARWAGTRGTLVLTGRGRLLRKVGASGGYSLLRGAGTTEAEAEALATALDLTKVQAR